VGAPKTAGHEDWAPALLLRKAYELRDGVGTVWELRGKRCWCPTRVQCPQHEPLVAIRLTLTEQKLITDRADTRAGCCSGSWRRAHLALLHDALTAAEWCVGWRELQRELPQAQAS
jgi:hypothetical protein